MRLVTIVLIPSIQGLGEGKLVSMEECKDFKRGIYMLEW